MKRLASEVLKQLQKRLARLERNANTSKKAYYDEYDLDSYIIEDMEEDGVIEQQVIEQEPTSSGTLMLVEAETERGREKYYVVLATNSRQIVLEEFSSRSKAERFFNTEISSRSNTGYGSLGHRRASFDIAYDLDSYIIEDMEDEGVIEDTHNIIEQEVTRDGAVMLVEAETERGRNVYYVVVEMNDRQIVLDTFKSESKAERFFNSEVANRNSSSYGSLGHRRAKKKKSSVTAEDSFLAELQADIEAGRIWDGGGEYNVPHAFKDTNCYGHQKVDGKGPGKGTCYRLHNNYGEANSGKPGSKERAEYNKKYREEYLNNNSHKNRTKCPDGNGGTMDC